MYSCTSEYMTGFFTAFVCPSETGTHTQWNKKNNPFHTNVCVTGSEFTLGGLQSTNYFLHNSLTLAKKNLDQQ